MKIAYVAALAAAFAIVSTSAIGGECCQGSGGAYGAYGAGVGSAAPVTNRGYGLPGGFENRIGNPYFYSPTPAHGYGYGGQGGGAVTYQAPVQTYGNGGDAYGGYGAQREAGYGGDVYSTHFGPGFHRHSQHGHYRFPYYSYRRPWYHVGPPAYAADTNFPW